MFAQVKSLFSNDIGIDLGTANSLVYVREQRERFARVEWGGVTGWVDPSQLQLLATLP